MKAVGNDTIILDNEELKESIKSIKILHKDQIWMKDVRISELNSTIKQTKKESIHKKKKEMTPESSSTMDFQIERERERERERQGNLL